MTDSQHVSSGALTPADVESIEQIVYKNGDDIATSIVRSFERLEERIDTVESRIYSRLAELEENLESRGVADDDIHSLDRT